MKFITVVDYNYRSTLLKFLCERHISRRYYFKWLDTTDFEIVAVSLTINKFKDIFKKSKNILI